MDKILFGDNQFFGINHMSEEKARAQSLKFQDINAVIRVLDFVYDMGINTFMCTTHDRVENICNHMRANPQKYNNFIFYPCMPYAHKYANAVTELGILGALKRFVPGVNMLGTVVRSGKAMVTRDVIIMMQLLIDAEMRMFSGLKTPVIFLQNVITDLLLGLDLKEIFVSFAQYISEKYNAEPGFITMNLPKLLFCLNEIGIVNPIICSSINKIGFRMCGGIDMYEKLIRKKEFRPIAMSIFASGAIKPEEALKYISSQRNIDSILFGASTKEHIREVIDLTKKYL